MNVPDALLRTLGATGGDTAALEMLVTQQRRRRRLVLRALLDAVAEAPPSVLPPAAAARVLADWRLLAAAERADPAAARRVVDYPLTGAWAERALRALAQTRPASPPPPTPRPAGPPPGASGRPAGRGGEVGPAGSSPVAPAESSARPAGAGGEGVPAGLGHGREVGPAVPAGPPPGASGRPAGRGREVGPAGLSPVAPAESSARPAGAGGEGVSAGLGHGREVGPAGSSPAAPAESSARPAGRGREAASAGPAVPAGAGGADAAAPAVLLAHLGALAAAAAARAGLRFGAEVPVRDGVVVLPTLGACTVAAGTEAVRVTGEGGRLWLHAGPGGAPAGHDAPHPGGAAAGPRRVEVRCGPDGVWRSAAAAWRPVRALWGPSGHPVLVDDADPYRDEERSSNPYGMSASGALDAAQHARWRTAWHDARPWLRLGGGGRALEADVLLGCLVPLAGSPTAHSSATRGEAFGALLSSTPRSGIELAGTIVHELQHTKLLALSALAVLHTAGDEPRYWAPWRPDPRPFDGLFQGAYAHLALADFHQRVALSGAPPAVRDAAWADHCRCRQQVEAALPQLLGSSRLTPQGRTLVTAMAAHHARLKDHAPPDGHLARATAYVETARVIWRRQSA